MAIFGEKHFSNGPQDDSKILRFPFNFIKKTIVKRICSNTKKKTKCVLDLLGNILKNPLGFYVFGENCFSRVSEAVLA